jgi:hypothetical protein
MIQFSDREIADEKLVLDSKTEVYYLGHHLTLRNCTLVLKVPARALVIARSRLIDCTVEAKRELIGLRWETSFLKGCRFTGRFSGNDFGRYSDSVPGGGIEDCDFSDAVLDACRFLDCDTRTLRFPRWPCFTILNPVQRFPDLRAAELWWRAGRGARQRPLLSHTRPLHWQNGAAPPLRPSKRPSSN